MKDKYTEMKELAKEHNIPIRINLYTRTNKCETILDLVGAYISKDYQYSSEFFYQIGASFPYSLHGEKDNYTAIDFSDGPMIAVGDILGKHRLMVAEINPPIITFIKS